MIKNGQIFDFVDPNNPDRQSFRVKFSDNKLVRLDGKQEDFVGVKWDYVESCANREVIDTNPSLSSLFS